MAVYTDDMGAAAAEQVRLETELRVALTDGQLALHLQPVVDIDDGTIVAAEALVRWNHPERGMLLPGTFATARNFGITPTTYIGNAASDTVTIIVVENPKVRLSTTKGDIVMDMLVDATPITTNNFMQYVEDRFYNGTIFHRVVNTPDPFVIQGGGFFLIVQQLDGQEAKA